MKKTLDLYKTYVLTDDMLVGTEMKKVHSENSYVYATTTPTTPPDFEFNFYVLGELVLSIVDVHLLNILACTGVLQTLTTEGRKIILTKDIHYDGGIFVENGIFLEDKPDQGFEEDGTFTLCYGMGMYVNVPIDGFKEILI